MVHRSRLAALRARTLVDELIAPAARPWRSPLGVEILEGRDVASPEVARRSDDWRPFAHGESFGPAWSRVWFRLRGEVPAHLATGPPWLAFDCGCEALLRRPDGRPWHGLDPNRTVVPLPPGTPGEGPLELLVEVHANRPLGATTFFFDAPETRARWATPRPGRLDRAELCAHDPRTWELAEAFRTAAELVEALGAGSTRGNALARALEDARAPVEGLRPGRGPLPAEAVDAALATLRAALAGGAAPSATRCFPVGHAHLDTAWLWDTDVTRHKLVRTVATALRTLESRPSFRFLCTQPQQYAWLEVDEPELFAEVRAAVAAGRWEPLGATWIEPDGNLPSGESFCRQLGEGVRSMRLHFGEHGAQRLLFLPDSFGFAASLPQLAALAGLDTFVTNKLWWSETTEFPHATFRWRGIDGTELLAHLTPGQDYNATLHTDELRRGERVLAERDETGVTAWLQPYGFGDGGGGPTPEQALRVELASECEGLPRLDPGGARAFCDALHAEARAAEDEGRPLPVHDGELYLELHRGTWTTQAALKRANVALEAELRREEALAVLADDVGRSQRARELWREVLLNQFHDILPGSGTREVVEEALGRYGRVERALAEARGSGAVRRRFNPTSATADGASPLGLGGDDAPEAASASPTRRTDHTLENGTLALELDGLGRIVRLERRRAAGPPLGSHRRPLFELHLHEDRPRRWEAWDIDEEALLRRAPVAGPATTVEPAGDDGFRVVHELASGTRIELTYRLRADSEAVEVDLRARWCEDRRLLRTVFPTGLRAPCWTASVPFGHVARPTTRNTPGERARFETPVHRWVDLAEPGRGLSVVSDAACGGAALDDELALSLLRATRFPDPVGDAGPEGSEHRFRFLLRPHGGDWRRAGVLDLAERIALADPAVRVPADARSGLFDLAHSGSGRGTVAAVLHAPSADGAPRADRVQVRLVESHGAHGTTGVCWRAPVDDVRAVDLLGRPDPRAVLEPDGPRTRVHLRPFQVVTLEATLDG